MNSTKIIVGICRESQLDDKTLKQIITIIPQLTASCVGQQGFTGYFILLGLSDSNGGVVATGEFVKFNKAYIGLQI